MANPTTAAEWTTTAENFRATIGTITSKLDAIPAQLAELQQAAQVARDAGDTALAASLRSDYKQAQQDANALREELANNERYARNADTQAAKALEGPPATSTNTPPATVTPNTEPTAVPPITPVPPVTDAPAAVITPGTGTNPVANVDITGAPAAVTPAENPNANGGTAAEQNAINAAIAEDGVNPYGPGYGQGEEIPAADIASTPAEVAAANDPAAVALRNEEQQTNRAILRQEDAQEAAAQQSATLDKARAQNTIANQRSTKNNNDWRVKLRLAPNADYLYAASFPGILKPLKDTGGVIFPYTPSITTSYKANYATADMTHSNYKGYFYQGSAVEPVTLSCPFTAQSTVEAEYLLAVVHFFKSVTKMFYGQDPQRGSPPPLVYLTGLGQFQFNEHPCVVQSFTYELPTDVDYIRAYSPNVNNSNMLQQRQASNSTTAGGGGILGGLLGGAVNRLLNANLPKGGVTSQPPPPTLASTTQPTYVPTKMNISITLLPVQSRRQVSQNFSLRQYANGDLLKGGFW
jgi:hypothetical protein